MEEEIRKQGILYLQQQRFGKRWKRVCAVVYRESSCSISRLEFFECKDGGSVEKSLRKQQEHKKVIRLSDCVRVSEVEVDARPRDTGSFLVETTDRIYVFAAERNQLDDWTHTLCEVAFPASRAELGGRRGSLHRGGRTEDDQGMEDNSLYSGRETVRDFRVSVRRTEASDRCRLKGDGVLRADVDALLLLETTGDVLFTWTYRHLRRFGRDKSSFSFEAGRRCESGEGNFEFDTKQGNVLFQEVEAAINRQRSSHPPQRACGGRASPDAPQQAVYSTVSEHQKPLMTHHSSAPSQQRNQLSILEPPLDKVLTSVKSLTLDPRGLPAPRKNQVKMISSCPLPHAEPGPISGPAPSLGSIHKSSGSLNPEQGYSQITQPAARGRGGSLAPPPQVRPEPEYSLPFDTIATNVMAEILSSQRALVSESGADPLYDSIDEMKIRNIFPRNADALGRSHRKLDHIYDEPEGSAAAAAAQKSSAPASLYDDPKEMRGEAWRIMGTADPRGHEYPYNPRVDDYAVPKRPKRAFPVTHSTNEEEVEEEEMQQEGAEPRDSPYNNVKVKM